eukprot:CAMPEP_0113943164 /NCGR_PEP_ID=MMETSP1339-20121228/19545_1 /TAXON_ID=94617 /ORGANISM="Fibrocapsa japonica" /LENGTH=484 /DNA_ID=CAMNT_0000947961 /DNA_START=67 /DNA_END=1517 /DNA_ORIENTATION=+ /assembly_acc=CAM_ASM_000762
MSNQQPVTGDDQPRFMQEATRKVKERAFYMKRAMDTDDLQGALSHASEMLRELRTSLLTPSNYYELYIKVSDELRYLEDYFEGLRRQGRPMERLYEQVQGCGNVLPRLYLLITVGGCYIKSKEAPAKTVLADLLEMTKGVQHPMWGLFLRHYLAHQTRDKLPDVGSEYADPEDPACGGSGVADAYEFVLQNFQEANRLWVRLQHQGASKDRKRRERERQALRILVGTNLVRLSQLEGIDQDTYAQVILPRILEQVSGCRDSLAQTYLMDCIIQVFPDEFHLTTLRPFLDTLTQLKEKVNVRTILESLMERLINFAENSPEDKPPGTEVYELFVVSVTSLLTNRPQMTMSEKILLQAALCDFAVKWHPDRLDLVDQCISTCASSLAEGGQALDAEAQDAMVRLLSIPLSSLALKVLDLTQYADLLNYIPWEPRKQIAVDLLRSVLSSGVPLRTPEEVEKLFVLIVPLLKDEKSSGAAGDSEAEGG